MLIKTTIGSMIGDSVEKELLDHQEGHELDMIMNGLYPMTPRRKIEKYIGYTGFFVRMMINSAEIPNWDTTVVISSNKLEKKRPECNSIW